MSSTKTCYKCCKDKSVDNFAIHRKRPDGLQSMCKPCANATRVKHYRESPAEKLRMRITAQETMNRNNEYLLQYLLKHPCIDCGETDPIVLEFDHRDDKSDNVANMVFRRLGIERLQREIDKCDIRCANCHRRKSHIFRGTYRARALDPLSYVEAA